MKICIALFVLAALAFGDAKSLLSLKTSKFVRSLIPARANEKRATVLTALPMFKEITKRAVDHAKRQELSDSDAEALLGLAVVDAALSEARKRHAKRTPQDEGEAVEDVENAVETILKRKIVAAKKRNAGLTALPMFKAITRRAVDQAKRQELSDSDAEALLGLAVVDAALSEAKKRHANQAKRQELSDSDAEALLGLAVVDAALSEAKKRHAKRTPAVGLNAMIKDLTKRTVAAVAETRKRNTSLFKRKAAPSESDEAAEALLGLAVLDEALSEKKRAAPKKTIIKRKALRTFFPFM